MDWINVLLANKSILGITVMDIVIITSIAFIFYLLKGIRKDMSSIKADTKTDTLLTVLEHQKSCNESNNKIFARRDEIALVKESIDRLADTVGEIRSEFSTSITGIHQTLIEIAQKK